MSKEAKLFIGFTIVYSIINFISFQVDILTLHYDKVFFTNFYSNGFNNILLWVVFHFSSLFITFSLLSLFMLKKKLIKSGINSKDIIFWKIILLITYLALLYERAWKYLLPKFFFNFILFSIYVHPQKGLIYRTNFSSFFLFTVAIAYTYYNYTKKKNRDG
jgi:hypothetical protein